MTRRRLTAIAIVAALVTAARRNGIAVHFVVEPRDLWVGAYWDDKTRRLYLLPVPCLGVVLDLKGWP